MDLFQIPGLAGLPAMLLTLIAMLIYGFYIQRNAKSKAAALVQESYEKVIKLSQERADILEKRVEDTEKENKHLEQTLTTILDVLKSREIYITISGHTINIREGKETTITRIQDDAK